ncbi:MAG: hypothetical protein KME21_25365 [Desmonostoc vinosum HA7617-LM4]|nr:hypothetical protein [Desmonostoc vinosum HA7617-LM4]
MEDRAVVTVSGTGDWGLGTGDWVIIFLPHSLTPSLPRPRVFFKVMSLEL